MNRENEQQIWQRYREERCSEDELRQLEDWYNDWNMEDRILLSEVELEQAEQIIRSKVTEKVGFDIIEDPQSDDRLPTVKKLSLRRIVGIAATIIIGLGLSISIYVKTRSTSQTTVETSLSYKDDVAPGKNTATLTLSDGKVLTLSDKKNAVVINASELSYGDGTKIDNKKQGESAVNKPTSIHSITTPRGGQYQVILADGTKVWLNAASTIRFPASFDGAKERRIEIVGEAYLQVVKDKNLPFIVVSSTQEIEVLGTSFNVNDYLEESFAKTTLVEGAIRVRSLKETDNNKLNTILKPGQESLIRGQDIEVRTVNVHEAIAWKDGDFRFEDKTVIEIMKQIARWYDVDIIYKNDVSDVKLNASISRNRNLSQILQMMEKTGEVKFKIEGRQIIVTK